MATVTTDAIAKAKRALDDARAHGSLLKIALAQAALNDLLDRIRL